MPRERANARVTADINIQADTNRLIQSTNDDRDAWLYNEKIDGETHAAIRLRLKKEHREWEQLETDQAIGKAIDRYCKRRNLHPPRRKPR